MTAAEERLANDPRSPLWGEHRARYRFAARLATGKRVLDVACGAGFGLAMLRHARACVIGVDLDYAALSQTRRLTPGASLVQGEAAALPLSDGCVDLVTSFETVEHVPDAWAFVRELRRVLRRGGMLILSTPNRAFGPEALHTANPFHVREFTAAELRALLEPHFAEVHVHGQWPMPAYRFVPFLMIRPDASPRALAWKATNRLPARARDVLARLVSGRPWYPAEEHYRFELDRSEGAHALLAVAR